MPEYFDAEMRLLQEAAQEFARAYPEKAGMLNLQEVRDRDPYVERLLEGMAFLTARVRQRIDDDVPEIAEALLSHLWPHFLRPFPSAAIIQFEPRPGQLQKSQTLARGTLLLSPPVGEERVLCRFRTTSPVTLQPLRLAAVTSEEAGHGGTLLRLRFQFDAGVEAKGLELERLKLHLHADPAVAMSLYHALVGQAREVRLRFPAQPTLTPQRLGGQAAIAPCHLAPEELLVPASGRSFHGFHLLQEYFCFREKYLFFELQNLQRIEWPENCAEFELEVQLGCLLDKEFNLSRDNFRLHCAPAVNLFSTTSEPIDLTHKRSEYPVLADAAAREGVRVYSVDKVTGTSSASGKRFSYSSLPSFKHGGPGGRFFQVRRQHAEGMRPTTALVVGGKIDYAREALSCEITATNGDYPRRHLQIGSLHVAAPEVPLTVKFSNITRPSRTLQPPRRRDYRLALVSHLAVNYHSLASVEAFRQLLALYDWTEQGQNQRRIDGIREIAVTPVNRIRKGALLRGLEVTLTLAEDHYLSTADCHLFGTVLHRFLSMYASVNAVVQTRIVLHPSNRELKWEPLPGENFPL